MAGEMGRSDQGNIAQRLAAATYRQRPVHRSPARHCLVGGEPALLVEWRRRSGLWEGRVLSMTWVDTTGWVTVQRWLPVHQIATADWP